MLAVLDNNDRLQCLTDDYFDSSLHTFLQGTAAFFTCSVLQTAEIAQYFKVGNKLSFVSNEVSYHFDITKMNKNEQLVTIQADSLTLELRNEFASEYKASKAMTFKQYLDVFLFAGDNPLVMGINEVSDKSLQAEWTGDGDSVLARLFSLANKFDAEIEFETVLNKHWGLEKVRLNVYRAHSDKYQGIGRKRTDIIMEYGNNVETVEYEENIDDLKTAIHAYGTDGLTVANVVIDEKDKNGNRLFYSPKGDISIRAVQSRDQFPSKVGGEGYIAKRWTYETTNENVLAGQALAELKKLCEPKVTVTIKGYEYLGIGDTVLVQNTAYVPTLNLSARISEQEIYFDDPSKNSSTFTNVEILKSQVDQSLIDRVNALIEETKPYTLSLVSDNGVTFKNSEGETTLSAIVYNGTQVITPDVTVRWYKDDVWVKTGYELTIQASNINAKAVYKAIVIDTNGKERATQDVTVFNVDDGKFSDLTDDEKKEIASHGEQFIAYAWRPDGKDRFTRVKPNENIITQSPSGVSLTSTTTNEFDFHDVFKISQNYQTLSNWTALDEVFTLGFSWESSTDLPDGASIGIFFGDVPWTWNFSVENKVSGKSGSISKTGNNGSGLYNSTQTGMTIRFKNIPIGTVVTITKVFVIAGRGQSFAPSQQDDYDNAVPRYIGRSLKDSTNPADYTWDPNPERKPWTAYAQGVNGEDLSLMPYGENKILDSSFESSALSLSTVNSATQTYDTSKKHSGNRSVKVVTSTTTTDTGLSISYSGLTVGTKYTLSVYVYTDNDNMTLRLRIANTSFMGQQQLTSIAKGDWRRVDYTFIAAYTSGFYLLMAKNVTFWVDDIKLELANTMGIPTPRTPAPSEDPLGAIPKYVGTAALPYEDPYKYEWKLNPTWLQQESKMRSDETQSTANEALEKAKIGAISGYLTNESILLDANANGVVTDFSQATGSFVVYDGQKKVINGVAYSRVSQTGVTVSIDNSGIYNVTAISSKVGTAILQATYNGVTLQKMLTVAKAQTGATGATGPQGDKGSKGDPTGIVTSDTEPNPKFVNMLWKHTGSISGLIKNATYRWTGSAWELYLFVAANISVDSLSAITANLGTVTAGMLKSSDDMFKISLSGKSFSMTQQESNSTYNVTLLDGRLSSNVISTSPTTYYNEYGALEGATFEMSRERRSDGEIIASTQLEPTGFTNYLEGGIYRGISFNSQGMVITPGSTNTGIALNTGIDLIGDNTFLDLGNVNSVGKDYGARMWLNTNDSLEIVNALGNISIKTQYKDANDPGNLILKCNQLFVRNIADSAWAQVLGSSFSQQSDSKYKYNIKDMPDRLNDLMSIDFKAYRLWAENGKYQEGILADQNKALPFVTHVELEGTSDYMVDMYSYVTFLAKSLQEAVKKIEELEGTVNEYRREQNNQLSVGTD